MMIQEVDVVGTSEANTTEEDESASHREQSTSFRRQEWTPLTVENDNTPALIHVGLSSPQQAVAHADCESHLMRGGNCTEGGGVLGWAGGEETVAAAAGDSHREQSTLLRRQERTPLPVEKDNCPALIHVGLFSPQQAVAHADCESHLITVGVGLDTID